MMLNERLCSIPIQAILADNNLQKNVKTIDNQFVRFALEIRKKVIKGFVFLKWCAYHSDFTPNKLDTRFKDWTFKGITAVCKRMKGVEILSFDALIVYQILR